MRIAATGAGGTGKTLTMQGVADLFGKPLMKSASREVFEELGISEEDEKSMTPDQLWDLQNRILGRKIEKDKAEEFIADRTVADHLAYGLHWAWEGMTDAEAAQLELDCADAMDRYDAIFYFAPGLFVPESDGVRIVKRSYQILIDTLIRGSLEKWCVPVYEVPFDTVPGRVRWIREMIKRQME